MLLPGRSLFDDFVEATKTVQSKERLYELFIVMMVAMGFDYVNFSVMYDRELAEQHWGFGLISTYPVIWQSYYLDRRFVHIDPVARRASGLAPPFWWRNLGREQKLSSQQLSFLREGEEAGLFNGLGIPFRGPAMQRAGVALATSVKRIIQPANLDIVVAICNHFYTVYKRVCRSTVFLPAMITLNGTEREVLIRAAHGRKDHEIAKSLNLRPGTINWHFRNIFVKFDVNTRTEAVAYALHNGIIEY